LGVLHFCDGIFEEIYGGCGTVELVGFVVDFELERDDFPLAFVEVVSEFLKFFFADLGDHCDGFEPRSFEFDAQSSDFGLPVFKLAFEHAYFAFVGHDGLLCAELRVVLILADFHFEVENVLFESVDLHILVGDLLIKGDHLSPERLPFSVEACQLVVLLFGVILMVDDLGLQGADFLAEVGKLLFPFFDFFLQFVVLVFGVVEFYGEPIDGHVFFVGMVVAIFLLSPQIVEFVVEPVDCLLLYLLLFLQLTVLFLDVRQFLDHSTNRGFLVVHLVFEGTAVTAKVENLSSQFGKF
jgi:hypothetical protein